MSNEEPDQADLVTRRVRDFGRELVSEGLPPDVVAGAFLEGARIVIAQAFGNATWRQTLALILESEATLDRPAGNA